MSLTAEEILAQLNSLANPENLAGMAHYGINPQGALGISMPTLRGIAKQAGRDHTLAKQLWASGLHEARILASLVDVPRLVTKEQMESWVVDFDSWDVCDQVCGNLFDRTPYAYQKAIEWSSREAEFVKRAGFVLMAWRATHVREAGDERNFVKKAVNWALRGIGKRNLYLNRRAVETAMELQANNSKAARWVAADALRELSDEKTLQRLH